MSDVYVFDGDAAAPTDPEQRRLLYLQRLQQAANAAPGQSASVLPQSIPSVPTAAPPVQAPGADGMLDALRAANAAPPVVPADQSPAGQVPAQTTAPQPSATQPAAGGMLDALRNALHEKVDRFVDSQAGYDENGRDNTAFRNVMNMHQAAASYLPGPVGDVATSAVDTMASKQATREALHDAVDTALDPATRARAVRGVARGAQQGLSGFNEGLGNVVFALPDALNKGTDYVAGKLAATFGASPPPPVPSSHDYYNRAFVDPAGAPQTKLEQRIRGAARSFGTDTPALLLGGGLATAGARSGVTLAEQEAPGLLETVREPATGLVNKLRAMVPNYINALHPTNIANAVRTSNLQGAADTALERVAAHPRLTAYGDLAKDWRAQKKREAQEAN
jgi:hypothetical protein